MSDLERVAKAIYEAYVEGSPSPHPPWDKITKPERHLAMKMARAAIRALIASTPVAGSSEPDA